MTRPFTVLIDLDSTTYDLLTPTLNWVNLTKGLELTPSDIKEWQWGKPLGVDLYSFWNQPGLFYDLKPFPHAKEALLKLRNWDVRQIFFSTLVDGPTVAWDKIRAVDRDFPFIGRRNILLTGQHKDIACADILVDDGPHNLAAFEGNGVTVLANLQGVGYTKGCKSDYVMTDWRQYPEIVLQELRKRG